MTSTKEFSRAMRQLTRVPAQVAREVSAEINALIQEGFDRGTDPYGRPWAPLRPATLAKGRRPPPLTDTGKGRAGVYAKPMSGAGILLVSEVPYMRKHQMGAPPRLVRRDFLPINVLPKAWNAAIKEAVEARVAKTLGVKSNG